MEDDLVMDVSGSWVRRTKTSAAAQLNQFSDVAETLFVAQYEQNIKPTCFKKLDSTISNLKNSLHDL